MKQSGIGIRELEKGDVHPCVEIVRENWGDEVADRFWDEVQHSFLRGMKWPPEYFVYEEGGTVIAFAGMIRSWLMNGVTDFVWINVKKEYQGYGYGSALTRYRVDRCRREGVSVINLMTQKPNFFEPFGFVSTYNYQGDMRSPYWVSMTLQLDSLSIQ